MDNYEILPNGVIRQKTVHKIAYDHKYSSQYDQYGEKGKHLSFLRLGVLIGALGHVPQSLVDVGYGNGEFLRACKTIIPKLYGCDISPYPVPEGCEKIEFHDISANVACFFDSLEHFDDIYAIKSIRTDYIFISVPWCHFCSEEWFLNWYHRKENEHLFHFNDKALVAFFKECEYECVYLGCYEDAIRKNPALQGKSNILSGLFKRLSSN